MSEQFKTGAIAINVRGDTETINKALKDVLNMGWWLLSVRQAKSDPQCRTLNVMPRGADDVAVDIARRKLEKAYGL